MRTETIHHQPVAEIDASACSPLATLSNPGNPADTALVRQSPVAGTPVPGVLGALVPGMAGPPMPRAGKPRNGKIARLPKPVRELVNRMLFNRIPQENIVDALKEIAIDVTQRNISNWKTRGGYREWRVAQEHALQLHLHQDNLIDLIRRHDANELPEVGLQAAATQLSQFFLTPAASQLLASDPKEYERRVSMLSRISGQLTAIQKYRDGCDRNVSDKHDPARIRIDTAGELAKLRHDWSVTVGDSPKDPEIPHRNELPAHADLFHLLPPEPPRVTMADILERMHKPRPAAKPEPAESAPSTR